MGECQRSVTLTRPHNSKANAEVFITKQWSNDVTTKEVNEPNDFYEHCCQKLKVKGGQNHIVVQYVLSFCEPITGSRLSWLILSNARQSSSYLVFPVRKWIRRKICLRYTPLNRSFPASVRWFIRKYSIQFWVTRTVLSFLTLPQSHCAFRFGSHAATRVLAKYSSNMCTWKEVEVVQYQIIWQIQF